METVKLEGLREKRWYAGGEPQRASLKPLGRHFILEAWGGGKRYLAPLSRCPCCRGHELLIDGEEYCEAECCQGFIEDLSRGAIPALKLAGTPPPPLGRPAPLREDTTNPLVTYPSPLGAAVLKGYREAERHNYEPYFYRYLGGSGITPPFQAYYLYGDSPLGLSTLLVKGEDGGAPFYRALLALLTRGRRVSLAREASLATESLARLHVEMRACSEWWCGSGVAGEEDVEEWKRRLEYYLSAAPRGELRERAAEALERLGEFRGCLKERIHQDLHLSQYIYSGDKYLIVDFEGEPGRPEKWRGMLEPPIRDFASLLRSLSYIAFFAVKEAEGAGMEETAEMFREKTGAAEAASKWARGTARLLAASYLDALAGLGGAELACGARSPEELLRLAEPWLVERGLYEVYYESMYRRENVAAAASTLAARVPL